MVILIATSKKTEGEDSESHARLVGIVLSLVMAAQEASTNIISRRLKDVHFSVVMTWHSLTGLTLCIAYIILEKLISGTPFNIYSWWHYGVMFGASIFDCLQITA